MNVATQESPRVQEWFLSILAHELIQPVNCIMLALEGVRGQFESQEPLDIAKQQARHMAQIIYDMIEFGRGAFGKLHLDAGLVDISTIITNAIATVRSHVADRGHQLAVALPREPVSLRADSSKLHQVLTNLLNNAAKFTEPGGHICVTAEAVQDTVVIRVRDNGRGISPDLLPRIFDPFQQGSQHTRERGGLGLGLSIAKSLVELHEGSIEAHSEGSNSGAEFVIRLPVGDCGLRRCTAKQN